MTDGYLQRAVPVSGVALPPAPPPPDPDPGPVPTLRNTIDRERVLTTVNTATDNFGERLAGLFPAVIDRINTYVRFNEGIWNRTRASVNSELGPNWEGIYIENFIEDNSMDASMSVSYFAYQLNDAMDSFGNSGKYIGLVITDFKYKALESITSLTNEQLSGILLHELLHPVFTTTMKLNNTQADGAYTNKTTFPNAYAVYIDALGLTDAEADGKIMTREFDCGSDTSDLYDGTSWSHWENKTRSVDGQQYRGIINDCLRTCYSANQDNPNSPSNWKLTNLSIEACLDVGMERIKDGSEGPIEIDGNQLYSVYTTEPTYTLPVYYTIQPILD